MNLLPWSSLLAERSSPLAIKATLTRALDVMILGFVDEGTKITETLYEHNALQFENEKDLVIGMYCVWSKNWPYFIKNPDPNKPNIKRGNMPSDEGDVDSSLKKWLDESKSSKLNLDIKALAEQFRKGDKNRQLIAQSPEAWKQLREKKLAEELQIEDINDYVEEGIKTIQQRFTNGPVTLDKSIPELVKFMDENYIAARTANPKSGTHMMVEHGEVPSTFIQSGASDEDIEDLEGRIGYTLPDDYKEFLRFSNGFYSGDDEEDMTGIFYGASAVTWDEYIEDTEQGLELLPYTYTAIELMDKIEWPKFQAISLGAGGDEGQTWLFEPENVKQALEEFERVYKDAPEKEKRAYERGALDLYGGLEEMRKLEWVVITWYHWAPDPEPYKGFLGYLKHAATSAQEKKERDEERARGEKRKRGDGGDGGDDAADEEGDEAEVGNEGEENADAEGTDGPPAKQTRST